MKKILVALIAVSVLSACDSSIRDTREDVEGIQQSLPGDCTIVYAGKARLPDEPSYHPAHIFVTRCGTQPATTISSSRAVSSGKTTRSESEVNIQLDKN